MTPILSYLLKANIALVLLYGFYFLFFRRDTFYGHIRWYFLIAIVSALIFPVINISAWLKGSPAAVGVSQYIPDINIVYHYVFTQPQTVEPTVAQAIPFGLILLGCWLSVALFMMGKRVFQFAGIVRLWRRYPKQLHRNSAIIAVDKNIQPFSFFGHIFLNPSLHSNDELDEIVTHEQVHCRQRHSIDNLLAEALVCLFWFNPVAWLLRRDLKQNLEYYADRITLIQGFDRKRYQYSLLQVCLRQTNYQIVNHFHFNNLKKRIVMLNKKETSRILTAKYLLVLPALAAVLLTVQTSGLQAKELATTESSSLADITILSVAEIAENDFTPVEEKPVNIILSAQEQQQNSGQQEIKPLIVVDGKVIEELNNLDPNNIESMTVLKGDAATTLYGEAAANGVLVITTKTRTNSVSQPAGTIVSGTVVDANGRPLPGTNVVVKGMAIGTMTDINGKFSLNVPINGTLQVSNVGMVPREITVGSQQVISVVLENQQEVNVSVYGIRRSEQGTNSIEVVNENQQEITIGNTGIRLRGNNITDPNTQPLFVVDGKVLDDNFDIKISPDDIQSMTVLKGEAAINLYGEKAKNGVLLITTKK